MGESQMDVYHLGAMLFRFSVLFGAAYYMGQRKFRIVDCDCISKHILFSLRNITISERIHGLFDRCLKYA